MAIDVPILMLPADFDEHSAWEIDAKGWWPVEVETPDQRRFWLTFFHPIRMLQAVDAYRHEGGPVFFESNLIFLESITVEEAQLAINELWRRGDLELMVPAR